MMVMINRIKINFPLPPLLVGLSKSNHPIVFLADIMLKMMSKYRANSRKKYLGIIVSSCRSPFYFQLVKNIIRGR
jgi:hypothetical protein